MDITSGAPAAPRRSLFLLETRAMLDFARMLPPLARGTLRRGSDTRDPLVIVVPGFGSGDSYTLPLRRHLKSLGYMAEGWGLGTNLGGDNLPHTQSDLSDRWEFEPLEDYRGEVGVPYVTDRLIDRVIERHEATGRRVVLIGWSLGGFLAREAARELPDAVEQVITMGSPVIGGPKYTAAAGYFKKRGTNLDWIEEQIQAREDRPIQQPITAIVSKTDGIVDWQAAIDRFSPNITHVEVDASHLGMGFNTEIWQIIETALQSRCLEAN